MVAQLVKKYPTIYGIRRFIVLFPLAPRHWPDHEPHECRHTHTHTHTHTHKAADTCTYVHTQATQTPHALSTYTKTHTPHVHICIYANTHVNIHMYYTPIYIYIYAYTCRPAHTYIQLHRHMYICKHTCTYKHTYINTDIYVYTHSYIHIQPRAYTHVNTHVCTYTRARARASPPYDLHFAYYSPPTYARIFQAIPSFHVSTQSDSDYAFIISPCMLYAPPSSSPPQPHSLTTSLSLRRPL